MSREGRETEEVGLVGWVVTKVSIGSNYYLFLYCGAHREGCPMPVDVVSWKSTHIEEQK